ncbi:MAG: peptidase [Verrucomicrobia bacterium]|nr:peptidase [Cytophagales bacterium]
MIKATLKSKTNEDICVMLSFENHPFNYLCDCGFASELTVKDCMDVAGIFISHTHIDHFVNFDQIFRHQLTINRKLIISGPKGIAKNVQGKFLGYNWSDIQNGGCLMACEIYELGTHDRITIYSLRPPDWKLIKISKRTGKIVFENEAFKVSYTVLEHSISSISYLFQEPNKLKMNLENCPYRPGKWVQTLKQLYQLNLPANEIEIEGKILKASELFEFLTEEKGYSFGFIMDHAVSRSNHQKIQHLFHQADEVYIEAYYSDSEKELALKNHHSTAFDSGTVLRKAQVKKALPVHFSRRYHQPDSPERQKLLEEFYNAFKKNENGNT